MKTPALLLLFCAVTSFGITHRLRLLLFADKLKNDDTLLLIIIFSIVTAILFSTLCPLSSRKNQD